MADDECEFATTDFPKEWKDTCLAVLRAYKAHLTQAMMGKDVSWEDVRDQMMVKEDTWERTPFGRKRHIRSKEFKRQHLESWDSGSIMTDPFFKYVDRFVNYLRVNGPPHIIDQIIEYDHIKMMDSLSGIYISGSKSSDIAIFLSGYIPRFLGTFDIEPQLFIQIRSSHKDIHRIVAGYARTPSINFGDINEKVIFFDGFMIPLSGTALQDGAHVTVKARYILQLTRPEYRSLSTSGYAFGELSISVTYTLENKLIALFIEIGPANSLVKPWIYKPNPEEVEVDLDYLSKLLFAGEGSELRWELGDYNPASDHHFRLIPDNYGFSFRNSIWNSYKGYLF